MFSKLLLATVTVSLSCYGFGQESEFVKSRNFYGISVDIGGGLELDQRNSTRNQVAPSGNPNLGTSLFWEHHRYFSKHHGLIVGGGINWMTFSETVKYQYTVPGSLELLYVPLGEGSRSSVFSIDLPLYYTYRIQSAIGEFNPYVGVNVRTIAGLVHQEGHYSQTEVIYPHEYFSEYRYEFNLSRVAPIIQPTLGISFVRELKNGARINYSFDYKLFLTDAFSYVRVSYDNTFKQKGGYLITPEGDLEPVDSYPIDWTYDDLKLNMSRFSLGVSYSFR